MMSQVTKSAHELGMAEDELSLIVSAIYYNQVDALRELLIAGVHGTVSSVDVYGLTPLHHAALHGRAECVELLLRMNADPDVFSHTDDNCSTPLHHAAKVGSLDCLRLLIEYGANLDVRNINGETVMDILRTDGPRNCRDYLGNAMDNRQRELERAKREDLFDVAKDGNLAEAERILESIQDKSDAVNRYYRGAHTLLHKASYGGHLGIAKLLLDNGANGRANADNGSTPLYAACYAGHLDLVKLLVERLRHLLMEPTTNDRSVPLHAAAIRGNTEIVKYLLQLRPEIEADEQVEVGRRANSAPDVTFHRRSLRGRRRTAERSNRGPEIDTTVMNVNVQDAKGLTPLHSAVINNKRDVVLELLKCTPIIKGPVGRPHPACLAIDMTTESHETALYYTILWKNYDIALLLLQHGADPNHYNSEARNRCTPLQIACRDKCYKLVKLLLEYKADPNKWNSESNLSPLNVACGNNSEDILKLLLENGAKDFNEVARNLAADNGFDSLVEIFLSNGVFMESEYKIPNEDSGLHPVIITWSKRKLQTLKARWVTHSALNKNTHALAALTENPRLLRGLITRLDLSANQLTSVPVLLFQLPSLRKLNLSENSISSLPSTESEHDEGEDFAWNCPLLEDLELQRNELTSLPNCLFDLPKLKLLLLSKNRIKEMPFKMWMMSSLRELLLQDNQLTCLPVRQKPAKGHAQFNSMPNSKNRKDQADGPKSTPNMANKEPGNNKSKRSSWDGESDESDDEEDAKVKSGLNKLDISDNKNIESLPEQLPCLAPHLSKLIAAGCGIASPIYISALPAGLTMLDLSRNKITTFDLTGGEPTGTFSCCAASHSRASKSVSAPEKLLKSRLEKKMCTHRCHRSLMHLTTLNIARNNLEEMHFIVTKQHGTTETLQCVITNIHTLNISHNAFKVVPPNIQKIKKLGHLEITGNPKIDSLPPELGLCLQLYELKFNPQQIRYPPKAIIDKKRENGQIDIQYIRRYLKRVCEQATPYRTIKLMFVGRSRKGKSTLLQQLRKEGTGSYMDSDYQQRFTERMNDETIAQRTNHDESTVGVDLCDWTYQKRQFRGANAREIKFSTWDFAGQEEYYATHTCFLSKRAIYVLVWKLTDGYEGIDQLESWLLNIQARAADSAVVIVGTHYDEVPTQNRKEIIESYRKEIKRRYVAASMGGGVLKLIEKGLPRVMALAEVSCKNKTEFNVKDLRNTIYETALALKDTRNDSLLEAIVPASYIEAEKAVVKIAKKLKKEKKYPVLDSKQFRSEVRREFQKNALKELKDEELDDAVQFLHECGVLLHFDDPSLKDQYFIDPQWLCDMLANVITIRDVNPFRENGVLKVDDLRNQIFRGQRFSSSHVENYIELMNKFEVAIKVADKYLLVPSFLPERHVGYQRVSTRMCPVLQQAMNVDTYLKHRVFRRQYLMAYVPSGFWARLITRLIADDRISKIVSSCMKILDIENEDEQRQAEYKESLACTAPPEWGCWKSGVELSCFDVKLMRLCQLDQGELFYGHDGRTEDRMFIKNAIHDSNNSRTVEILVPSIRLSIGLDAQTQAFRLVSVEEDNPQTGSELLTLAVEHMDNLLADWFSPLDSYQNIHGDKSVRRVSLCPDCLSERIHRRGESTSSDDAAKEEASSSSHSNTEEPASSPGSEQGPSEASDESDSQTKLKKLAKGCINGFEFEEAVKSVDDYKPLICYTHGEVEFKKIFLDVMFEDLPEGFIFSSEQVQRTKFIAAGSYGAVFKGTLTANNESRVIAIKVPHNTDACGTTNSMAIKDVMKNKNLKEGAPTLFTSGIYKTIRQELSILVPVSHKHILDLIGVAFSPLCLLIEFAPKGSLNHVLSQYNKAGQKLDSYAIQQCVLQVSDALRYLHGRNIIYRDLKSENVLVWSFPEPQSTSLAPRSASIAPDIYLKLADYGISRPVAITGLRGFLGTHGFIAPEIIRYKGKETYSKKVDSFSFGSFMYELISRKIPFEEVGEGSIIDQLIVEGKLPRVPTRDKRIPVPILSLLYKCWEHDPIDRPSQSDIYSSAKLKEFPRLLHDFDCEESFKLQCALTTNKRAASSIENCADSRDLIGSEIWLCCNEETPDGDGQILSGRITVLNYSDGKCKTLKKIQLADTVLVACVVGSTVWVGTKKGALLVYCSMTFKPLALAYPSGSRSILSILHSLACHCVVIGSIDGSIMSYHDNLSSYIYNVPDADVLKYFGNVDYNEPIKEMIHNRVFTDSMIVNPIVCLAAVPSRANHSPMEDTVKFFGSGGEPIASTSRDHIELDCERQNCGQHPLRYELWCGLQRGLINILDLENLEKVRVLSAREGEINNPAIKQLCVTRIETRRVFQTTCHPQCPAEGVNAPENESTSVWIVLYPGTCVYRWNVDRRKIEAKFDAALQKPENELNSFKSASKQSAVQVSNAQILTVVVVEDYLYLGTTFGCMIVCESMSLTPLSTIRCFSETLDCLIPLQMTLNRGNTGQHKDQLVLASGRKCMDKWNKDKRKKATNANFSTILTWYADQWHT